jgi:hypothetical protein
MNFTEQFVQRDQHRLYVREYAGEEPTIILMHGIPDNFHLYDVLWRGLAPRTSRRLRRFFSTDSYRTSVSVPRLGVMLLLIRVSPPDCLRAMS